MPEIRLHLATEVTPLWHATEATLEKSQLPPPYWAFAWPGGQALARHLLDHPELVAGKSVLDIGAGSGLVSIAAKQAGAAHVTAAEIDAFAIAAIRLNAALNAVSIEIESRDLIGGDSRWDTILVGDMCYERPLADRLTAWLRALAARGATVLLGDPGRAYLPKDGLRRDRTLQRADLARSRRPHSARDRDLAADVPHRYMSGRRLKRTERCRKPMR